MVLVFPSLEGTLHPKRRRTSNSKLPEDNLEAKELSISRSQQSSPSQSDHEQTSLQQNIGNCCPPSRVHLLFGQNASNPSSFQLKNVPSNQTNSRHTMPRTFLDIYPSSEHPIQTKPEQKNMICSDACRAQCNAAEPLCLGSGKTRNLVWFNNISTFLMQFFLLLSIN